MTADVADVADVEAYLAARADSYVGQLKQWCAIPSVSTQPAHKADVLRAAQFAAERLVSAGRRAAVGFDVAPEPATRAAKEAPRVEGVACLSIPNKEAPLMTHSLRRAASLALAGALTLAAGTALAEYPERPITLIVPWGAGGGTDATGRMIASLLEEELGQPVNVVNRTGGSGVVGHSAIATAEPDGYTIGTITVETGMMHWAGLTDLTGADYTPIALYNYDPAGLQVSADSPWETAQDVIDAVKAAPGEHKGSGTGQGGIWHLALAGMLNNADIAPDAAPWVPSKGAAPGLQELAAGGVDIVTCSVVEAAALIDAGKVKSLAVMDSERLGAFPDVPTLAEATGLDWQLSAWRGLAGPKGMPEDVTAKLTTAFENVWQSDQFQDFMKDRGFGLVWKPGPEFAEWMVESDASLGQVMAAVGLAK